MRGTVSRVSQGYSCAGINISSEGGKEEDRVKKRIRERKKRNAVMQCVAFGSS